MLWLILACASPVDPCESMCEAAAARTLSCLDEQGLSWGAAGYDDERDYLDACTTWAWEMRLLEADAGPEGAVDRTCEEREQVFTDGDCDDWAAMNWNEVPW